MRVGGLTNNELHDSSFHLVFHHPNMTLIYYTIVVSILFSIIPM